MALRSLLVASLVVPLLAQDPNALTEAERKEGWIALFDGKSLAGWRTYRGQTPPAKGWVVEEGALRCQAKGGGGDLASEGEFGDFELAFEWKVAPGANSGVMYRVSEAGDHAWRTGPEYQILDDGKHADGRNAKTSAASLYALVAPAGKKLAPVGEWNQGKVVVDGGKIEHWLNGVKVVEATLGGEEWKKLVDASKFKGMGGFGASKQGRFVLQDHGDDVWFRGVKVRPLQGAASQPAAAAAAAPASATTAAAAAGPAEKLFNGKDLEGWTVFTDDPKGSEGTWRVEDGVLICRGLPHGYIKTDASYTNYVLELEWRWPPKGGGNSGVLLRVQEPDKVWPKSIEAQLQAGNAGDFWNIGQFGMKTDPNRTSGRNVRKLEAAEKDKGEWNRYVITVNQGNVKLEINGKLVNEATECDVVPGRIALQSEGAEIHFREIVLKKL